MKRSAIILSLLLAACAHAPQPAPGMASPEAGEPRKNFHGEAPEQPQNLPNLELDGQMFYGFLLGEIAGQRGNPELAVQVYSDLAESTRDPRVARRAAQMAFEAHQPDKALDLLGLWLKLEPSSHQAKQMLITALVTGGKLEDARPYLVETLAAYPDKVGHTFVQLYPLLARHPDKEEALNLLRDLAQPYPEVAEAHWVLAQTASAADKQEQALSEIRKARALRPDWELAVLIEAQLLRDTPQAALNLLKGYLADHPDAAEVRTLYARTLVDQKQYPDARTEFQKLLAARPDNSDLAFAVAVLSMQIGELDRAEGELRQALEKGKKDEGTVYYYLGQLNESRKREEAALQDYRKVEEGEYVFPARLRVVYLLYGAGKLEEAREYLHGTPAQNNQQRVQLLSIEAHMLRDAKQPEAAYQVLVQGLEKLPNHPDLLYAAAMLADQLGKHDAFEQMMRKVIELNPNQAQAYNAIGYSLLDRNNNVEEGMQLVEKAYQLSPNDAAILDSVGWGHYRLGNLPKSLEFLRRAYTVIADPEIAAHLGEVLWVQGDKDEARKVWEDALKTHPDNPVLQAVVKKFQP